MRYAILGDIHSNLIALEAVLKEVDRLGVDQVLSVGDVVGYGAAPREVMDILRERNIPAVKGNHDAAVIGELETDYFNPLAKAAVEWTRAALTEGDLDWLAGLELLWHSEDCAVGHGTYAQPERFDYIQSVRDAEPSLDQLGQKACFVGHTHVPVTILRLLEDPARTFYTMDAKVDLSVAQHAIVNVGSVGQPRDEDPRAALGIYDAEREHYELHRVEYEIEKEAQRIRAAGLPEMLAGRLFMGI